VHFSDLSGDLMNANDVNSKTLPGGQGLAGKLQQDAFECESQEDVLWIGICFLESVFYRRWRVPMADRTLKSR